MIIFLHSVPSSWKSIHLGTSILSLWTSAQRLHLQSRHPWLPSSCVKLPHYHVTFLLHRCNFTFKLCGYLISICLTHHSTLSSSEARPRSGFTLCCILLQHSAQHIEGNHSIFVEWMILEKWEYIDFGKGTLMWFKRHLHGKLHYIHWKSLEVLFCSVENG